MDWFVVRHPDIDGAGVVPESALEHHRLRGWARVSDAIPEGEKDHLELDDYLADLDATTSDEPAKSAPAKSTKEK